MRTIIDLGSSQRHIIDTPTSVDCARDVRFRRTLRTLVECMVPACCAFPSSPDDTTTLNSSDADSTVTGTFFGHRNGRVSFCIQDHTRGRGPPLLLLEFAVPTSYLAREMQHGLLRIALECDRRRNWAAPLYDVPVWCMYCNGRKVGFATMRQMTAADEAVLKMMQSVSVGAGVLQEDDGGGGGGLMYLRASFERVVGSVDSEGSSGQELSVFLLRS